MLQEPLFDTSKHWFGGASDPTEKNTFSISRVLLQDSERLQSGNIKITLLTVEILGKYGGRKNHENRVLYLL